MELLAELENCTMVKVRNLAVKLAKVVVQKVNKKKT